MVTTYSLSALSTVTVTINFSGNLSGQYGVKLILKSGSTYGPQFVSSVTFPANSISILGQLGGTNTSYDNADIILWPAIQTAQGVIAGTALPTINVPVAVSVVNGVSVSWLADSLVDNSYLQLVGTLYTGLVVDPFFGTPGYNSDGWLYTPYRYRWRFSPINLPPGVNILAVSITGYIAGIQLFSDSQSKAIGYSGGSDLVFQLPYGAVPLGSNILHVVYSSLAGYRYVDIPIVVEAGQNPSTAIAMQPVQPVTVTYTFDFTVYEKQTLMRYESQYPEIQLSGSLLVNSKSNFQQYFPATGSQLVMIAFTTKSGLFHDIYDKSTQSYVTVLTDSQFASFNFVVS